MNAVIFLCIVNGAFFIAAIVFFVYGTRALKEATATYNNSIEVFDASTEQAQKTLAKQKELGEVLREVKELSEEIKSGKVKYVP